jgi:SAM-dependent methyltransferase
MYVRAFRRFSHRVFGVDIDEEKVIKASSRLPNISVAPAESLPYPDGTFDLVFSHEVIEHVADDRQAIAEAVRVLRAPIPAHAPCGPASEDSQGTVPPESKTGGKLIIFAPNRLYPFETHGVYWRGRYQFGNIPLVNYLPDRWRNQLCPHVRAYTCRDLHRLLDGLPVKVVIHTQVFPGYDKIFDSRPALGSLLRRITYFLENTSARTFGLSHLLIIEKIACRATTAQSFAC